MLKTLCYRQEGLKLKTLCHREEGLMLKTLCHREEGLLSKTLCYRQEGMMLKTLSKHKGVNQRSKCATQVLQQRPESPTCVTYFER